MEVLGEATHAVNAAQPGGLKGAKKRKVSFSHQPATGVTVSGDSDGGDGGRFSDSDPDDDDDGRENDDLMSSGDASGAGGASAATSGVTGEGGAAASGDAGTANDRLGRHASGKKAARQVSAHAVTAPGAATSSILARV